MTRCLWIPATLAFTAALAACDVEADAGPGSGSTPGDARRFFMPTGAEAVNTGAATIETDATGRMHVAYPAYSGAAAYYATCAADCRSTDDVEVVTFPAEGGVASTALALGADGRPRLVIGTRSHVYYASCAGDCARQSSWTMTAIVDHDNAVEVTGEALAIAPDGKPAFVMHSYRSLLPVGASPPATWWMTCEGDCSTAAGWRRSKIADQVWQESTLRFGKDGVPRLATVAMVDAGDLGAYLECRGDCTTNAGWKGTGLEPAYENIQIERIDPAISMELTAADGPRVVLLTRNAEGVRGLGYFSCDGSCSAAASWKGLKLVENHDLGAGVDLKLDGTGAPRIAYTGRASIMLGVCEKDCVESGEGWRIGKVEFQSDLAPDEWIWRTNCTDAAWFLRQPSLALGKDGAPRVVYRAEDISGGMPPTRPDPSKPPCKAGIDMTLTRLAQLRSLP